MSKTLGFIHYIMFDKIRFQDSITDLLIKFAEDNNIEIIRQKVDSQGEIEEGKLEDIIDDKNIHQWIQKRVIIVEKRFMKSVETIMDKDIDLKKDILKLIYEKGLKDGEEIEKDITPKEIYGYISSKFLDGMPCDRAIAIEEEKEDSLIYTVEEDLHTIYWPENIKNIYWDIRDEYIKGLLCNLKYSQYRLMDYRYEIR
ncbi:MAG: hypothetical protein GX982_03335 [Tissierellia bacterium]|nr:hypothetical protein [Tissierellia bacterium]